MKSVWLIKFRLPLAAMFALSVALGCSGDIGGGSTQDPLDGLPEVTDNIQIVSEATIDRAVNRTAAGLAVDFAPSFEEASSKAFLSYAKIQLQFESATENQSLNRSSYNCAGIPFSEDWPDFATDVGANCFQQVAAATRSTTTYPWAAFFVNHTLHNTGTHCHDPYLATFTKRIGANIVNTDLAQRVSWIFLTDIFRYEGYQAFIVDCPFDQQLDLPQFTNVVNHFVTQAYAAERAGLTENDATNSVYHSGTVPAGRADVMKPMSLARGEYLGHYDVVFDKLPGDSPTANWTCRSNLLHNRTP